MERIVQNVHASKTKESLYLDFYISQDIVVQSHNLEFKVILENSRSLIEIRKSSISMETFVIFV